MSAMSGIAVHSIERMELSFAPRPWPFADERRAEIDAHFAELQRQKPALYNGQILLLREHAIAGGVLRGSFLPSDYASFLVWQQWGWPAAGVVNAFAQGVLRTADGAFLMAVMGPHTANDGRIYFPSGTPEPQDVVGTVVDLESNVRREVAEETGLTEADYAADAGWSAVDEGARMALMKVLHMRESATAARDRIMGFLAREREPELSDIRIVRGPGDLDPMMPGYAVAYLNHMWSRPDRP